MKNFVQEGALITVLAAAAVGSGSMVKVGGLLGVASSDAEVGEQVSLKRMGVFENMPKTTGTAWVEGDKLYWNDTSSKFTTSASGNSLAGVAVLPADSGDAVGTVLLTGQIG